MANKKDYDRWGYTCVKLISKPKKKVKKVKKGKYKGIFEELKQRYREAMWGGVKEWLESFMTEQKCHSCHGKRLNKIALSIKVADKNIDDVVCHSVKESYEFFENLKLSDNGQIIAVQILKEIRSRLRFLMIR